MFQNHTRMSEIIRMVQTESIRKNDLLRKGGRLSALCGWKAAEWAIYMKIGMIGAGRIGTAHATNSSMFAAETITDSFASDAAREFAEYRIPDVNTDPAGIQEGCPVKIMEVE